MAAPKLGRRARAARATARSAATRPRVLAAALAVLAAAAVYAVSVGVFPYHSTNHDEGVYLQQAAMLLEGQLYLHPPVGGSFRPWFFVRDGALLYPKYSPVPAAVFAAGKLAGGYRLALAGVAAANVALAYAVVAEAFDRTRGVLAAGFVLASPLFLVDSAVFLPYAPTTLWNLVFAFAYLRADRTGDRRWAAAAGGAAGVAFFARPFTAVLFAAPFVAHALWTVRRLDRAAVARQATTAGVGLVGVAVALGYNALVTGSPLLFPYQAFAPLDGLGFGYRRILEYDRTYTPALALLANVRVVSLLFTQWVAAGPLGTALAAVGLAGFLGRLRGRAPDPARARRAVLAGLFVSVVVGNVFFWGNLNVLGDLADPTDGLVSTLGPFYHFDLLVPTAAFGAHGAVLLARRARGAIHDRFDAARARRVGVAGLVVAAAVFGGAAVGAATPQLAENRANSDQLAAAYEPFEGHDLDGAVVFLPTPYGDWLNHPFQALRNDPGFDGPTVYAMRENQFAVVDAFPDRTYYRYTYRGAWEPFLGDPVEPRLQRVRAVRGERIAVDAAVGVPPGAERVTFRLSTGGSSAYYVASGVDPGGSGRVPFRVVVGDGRARLGGERLNATAGNATVPVAARDAVEVTAFVDFGTRGFDYRLELPVAREGGEVRALTPALEVCRDARLCGGEAAYVPGTTDEAVFVRARVNATG